ncbi:MAG: rlmN, partial [Chloroflexi bacterium]|nr:rlmN [Chloroflexota bacterium]
DVGVLRREPAQVISCDNRDTGEGLPRVAGGPFVFFRNGAFLDLTSDRVEGLLSSLALPLVGRDDRTAPNQVAVTDLTLDMLEAALREMREPTYRARQIYHAVHGRHVASWSDLTDLPASLREALAGRYRLRALQVATRLRSSDGTVKLLLAAHDGQLIESVQIPGRRNPPAPSPIRTSSRGSRPVAGIGSGETGEGRGQKSRLTVCVSSQVGCALACGFCATGQMGFTRNLSVGEIVDQVYRAEKPGGARRVDNVVFMGMGEPLHNYDAVVTAIQVLEEPLGYGFSPRRATVSTSGLAPEIRRLADEDMGVRLAVSLHAPDDALRSRLMPINRRYSVAEVLEAADYFAERSSRRVSFEYVMLADVNDSDRRAAHLAELLHGRNAHVNLIPYNQTFSGYSSSPPERIRAFAEVLRERSVPCSIRASRGQDIAAACGQLKVEQEREAQKMPL